MDLIVRIDSLAERVVTVRPPIETDVSRPPTLTTLERLLAEEITNLIISRTEGEQNGLHNP